MLKRKIGGDEERAAYQTQWQSESAEIESPTDSAPFRHFQQWRSSWMPPRPGRCQHRTSRLLPRLRPTDSLPSRHPVGDFGGFDGNDQDAAASLQEHGYITYDDINDILPDNLSPEDLDSVLSKLRSLDVEIVMDQAEAERAERGKTPGSRRRKPTKTRAWKFWTTPSGCT